MIPATGRQTTDGLSGIAARAWQGFRRRVQAIVLPRPSAAAWDRAFAGGRWDFLLDQSESARLALTAHCVRSAGPADATIVDTGCGEGLLADSLASLPYRSYRGIDLSRVAIERAQTRATGRAAFEVGDAATWRPDVPPDIIILNEVLYYLADPAATVAALLASMRPGRALIVSNYDKWKTRWLWRLVRRQADVIELVTLRNDEGTR